MAPSQRKGRRQSKRAILMDDGVTTIDTNRWKKKLDILDNNFVNKVD